jgi:hypothetical protein
VPEQLADFAANDDAKFFEDTEKNDNSGPGVSDLIVTQEKKNKIKMSIDNLVLIHYCHYC